MPSQLKKCQQPRRPSTASNCTTRIRQFNSFWRVGRRACSAHAAGSSAAVHRTTVGVGGSGSDDDSSFLAYLAPDPEVDIHMSVDEVRAK